MKINDVWSVLTNGDPKTEFVTIGAVFFILGVTDATGSSLASKLFVVGSFIFLIAAYEKPIRESLKYSEGN